MTQLRQRRLTNKFRYFVSSHLAFLFSFRWIEGHAFNFSYGKGLDAGMFQIWTCEWAIFKHVICLECDATTLHQWGRSPRGIIEGIMGFLQIATILIGFSLFRGLEDAAWGHVAAPPTLWSGREATSGLLVSRYGKVVRFLKPTIVGFDFRSWNHKPRVVAALCRCVFNLNFVCDLKMVVVGFQDTLQQDGWQAGWSGRFAPACIRPGMTLWFSFKTWLLNSCF